MLSRTHGDDEHLGVTLSGGQWQRVALARCLLRTDAELLVLDEPTAGLDAEGEHRVHATLRRHAAGRTDCWSRTGWRHCVPPTSSSRSRAGGSPSGAATTS